MISRGPDLSCSSNSSDLVRKKRETGSTASVHRLRDYQTPAARRRSEAHIEAVWYSDLVGEDERETSQDMALGKYIRSIINPRCANFDA